MAAKAAPIRGGGHRRWRCLSAFRRVLLQNLVSPILCPSDPAVLSYAGRLPSTPASSCAWQAPEAHAVGQGLVAAAGTALAFRHPLLSWLITPTLMACGKGSVFSRQSFLQDQLVQRQFGYSSLQPIMLPLKLLQALGLIKLQATFRPSTSCSMNVDLPLPEGPATITRDANLASFFFSCAR